MNETKQIRLAPPLWAVFVNAVFGALLAAAILCPASHAAAQASQPAPATTSQPHKATAAQKRHRKAAGKPAAEVQAAPAPVPEVDPAPPAPKWPANEEPNSATISWDSHGLKIDASNSSLNQILKEVATDTGARLAGLGKDQRIFGAYGPGPAREVLSKLLDGTGYNVLMTGGQGTAPPTQIVLSTRGQVGQQPQARTRPASEEDADEDEQPADEPELPQPVAQPQQPQPQQPQQQPPSPVRNPFGTGMRMGFPGGDAQQQPGSVPVNPQQ